MKKHLKRFLVFCLFMTLILFPGRKCQAAGLEQTAASRHSVTVRWALKENALRYRVYAGTCNADSSLYAEVDDSVMEIKIRGLPDGSSNYIRVDYEYEDGSGAVRTGLAGYTAAAKTLPSIVQNVRQTGWYDRAGSCSVGWDKIACADSYEYIVRTIKGKKIAAGRVRSNIGTARINRIAASRICTISVRACVTVGKEEFYGGWSDTCCLFAQPRILTAAVSENRLVIQWESIKDASGYDVYVSRKGTGGYEKVKSVSKSKTSAVISKYKQESISQENVYYVYVTAKKKTGKKILNGGQYFYRNTKNNDTGYFS